MNPIFALVDCNNFYASCEKLFAPQLKNVPVLVLSNNDGCVNPLVFLKVVIWKFLVW